MSRPGIKPGPGKRALKKRSIQAAYVRWLFVTSSYETANVATEQIFGEYNEHYIRKVEYLHFQPIYSI
jgi:hypothetical protein